jgi:Arc/MetJ-type ribon-helix-helix transcriptional regulator
MLIREALRLLERQETEREEALRQGKAKLRRGAAQADRGELLDGVQVFEELRAMIDERRGAKPVRR